MSEYGIIDRYKKGMKFEKYKQDIQGVYGTMLTHCKCKSAGLSSISMQVCSTDFTYYTPDLEPVHSVTISIPLGAYSEWCAVNSHTHIAYRSDTSLSLPTVI